MVSTLHDLQSTRSRPPTGGPLAGDRVEGRGADAAIAGAAAAANVNVNVNVNVVDVNVMRQ